MLRVTTGDDLSPVNVKAFFELNDTTILPEEYNALIVLQSVLQKAQNAALGQ